MNLTNAYIAIIKGFCLILGGAALLLAIWGGLIRIGWNIPIFFPGLAGIHGPLLVCGFMGTVFGLERAGIWGHPWGYSVPGLIVMGALTLLVQPIGNWGPLLVTLGSIGFLVLCILVLLKKRNMFNFMVLIGSVIWLSGIVIWLAGWPVFYVYLWWMGFVLFTLAGQRLELAQRVQIKNPPYWILWGFLGIVFLGQLLMVKGYFGGPETLMEIQNDAIYDPRVKWGMRVAGFGMAGCSIWFIFCDVVWSLLKQGKMSRYTGMCLISAYFWLGVSGVISMGSAGLVSGVMYDALIHSFFIGFDWFIIFAYAPLLVMNLLGVPIKSFKLFNLFIYLLHFVLSFRIFGDLTGNLILKKWGGLLDGVVILLFLVTLGVGALWQKVALERQLRVEKIAG